jgi:hypothetical protein
VREEEASALPLVAGWRASVAVHTTWLRLLVNSAGGAQPTHRPQPMGEDAHCRTRSEETPSTARRARAPPAWLRFEGPSESRPLLRSRPRRSRGGCPCRCLSLDPLLLSDVRRTGGQTTQTDSCSRHNRASRRGRASVVMRPAAVRNKRVPSRSRDGGGHGRRLRSGSGRRRTLRRIGRSCDHPPSPRALKPGPKSPCELDSQPAGCFGWQGN